MKACGGSGCIDPHSLNLSTSGRRSVSFTPRLLYPRGKSPRYPLHRRLGRPQSPSRDVEKRKFLTLLGVELRPLGRPARSQSLYRLRYSGSIRCSMDWLIKKGLITYSWITRHSSSDSNGAVPCSIRFAEKKWGPETHRMERIHLRAYQDVFVMSELGFDRLSGNRPIGL
jgi:hypothetical protein